MRQPAIYISNTFWKQIMKNFIGLHKNTFAVFNIIIKQNDIKIAS